MQFRIELLLLFVCSPLPCFLLHSESFDQVLAGVGFLLVEWGGLVHRFDQAARHAGFLEGGCCFFRLRGATDRRVFVDL